MMLKRMIQLVAVFFGLGVAKAAQAENVPLRHGFWLSGALGMGTLRTDGGTSRETGVTGDISLGGTLSQRWLVGVGSSAWSKSENGGRLTVGTLDARVRFYPSATGGFFLTGGIGAGSVRASVGGISATDNGAGAIFGLGYDYRVARNASITPYWNGFAMKSNDNDANVGQVGLAITLH